MFVGGWDTRIAQVGPYRVLEPIARGGMGQVFKVQAPDGRVLALKLLLTGGSARAGKRFQREGRLQSELGFADGFVPLLDLGESEHGPYLVMPLLVGGSLRSRLEAGPLALSEAATLGEVLARALERAHSRGVIHRDLKPDNVLFDELNRPFLADLGLAKHLDSLGLSEELSRTGDSRGTPGYMAPEQVRDAKSVGPPADVFALGVILYEALCGVQPFPGSNTLEVVSRTVRGEVTPLRTLRPDAPRVLARAIERAVHHDPARRPSLAELRQALAQVRAPAPGRRPAWVLPLAIVVAGAAASALLLASRAWPGPAEPTVAPTTQVEGGQGGVPPSPPATAPPGPAQPEVDPLRGWPRGQRLRPVQQLCSTASREKELVNRLAVDADERLLLSGCLDGAVRLRDLASGEDLRLLSPPGQGDPANVCAFLPDGEAVAGFASGRIRRWDPATGELRGEVQAPSGLLHLVPAGLPGCVLVGCSNAIELWDLKAGRRLRSYEVRGQVFFFLLGADGRTFLAGGGDTAQGGRQEGFLGWWELEGGARLGWLEHPTAVLGVEWAEPGRRVWTGDMGGTLREWDLLDGALLREERLIPAGSAYGHLRALRRSPDGATLYAAGDDARVHLLGARDGSRRGAWEDPFGFVNCLALAPGRGWVLAGAADGTIYCWDAATGARRWERRPLGPCLGLFVAPDRSALVGLTMREAPYLTCWDGAGTRRWSEPISEELFRVAVAPGGRRVALLDRNGQLELRDGLTGAVERRLDLELSEPLDLHFLGPDDAVVISRSGRRERWSLGDPPRRVYRRDDGGPFGGTANRLEDGRRLGVVTASGHCAELSLEDGELTVVGQLDLRQLRESALVAVLPRRGGVAMTDKQSRLLLLRPGGAPQLLVRLANQSIALAVSPDGSLLLSGDLPGAVLLWDLADGREVDRLDLAPLGDLARSLSLADDGSFWIGTQRGGLVRYAPE